MLYRTVDIRNAASQDYAHLDVYALDACNEMPNSSLRPCVLICPGGAYAWTSHREGEPVAMKFLAAGYHVAVLWYSVRPAVFPTALLEVAASVYHLRTNAQEYHIDMNRINVAGFSAGGHLAASYGCFWNCDFVSDAMGLTASKKGWLKPNGLILGYPVITTGELTHEESVRNLMGEDESILRIAAAEEIIERLRAKISLNGSQGEAATKDLCDTSLQVDFQTFRQALSLEKQVTADTPRTFIWHTVTDGSVPVENTLGFAGALRAENINFEMHVYPVGGHGLSLANAITLGNGRTEEVPEVQGWIDEACRWVGM